MEQGGSKIRRAILFTVSAEEEFQSLDVRMRCA